MTAATIERLANSGRGDDIPTQVNAIHDAVGRMQRHVRVILERLRPIRAMGLAVAIDRLAAFWRSRRPDIAIVVAVAVEEDRISDDLKETIYRIVQEGASNAIRHGKPTRVDITIAHASDDGIRVKVADDGRGMEVNGMTDRDPAQLGLVGMRERVMAMAGSLSIQRGANGHGLTLVAWLPSLQCQAMAVQE
jgi:two-component system sensor histidine kinase UhpB